MRCRGHTGAHRLFSPHGAGRERKEERGEKSEGKEEGRAEKGEEVMGGVGCEEWRYG